MNIRPVLLQTQLPVFELLQIVVGGNETLNVSADTVFLNQYTAEDVTIPLFIGNERHIKHAFWLLPQPLFEPQLFGNQPGSTSLGTQDGSALTATYKYYLMTSDMAGVPWDPNTLTWNNAPAFPTDPRLIVTATDTIPNVDSDRTKPIPVSFDLRGTGLIVYGFAFEVSVSASVTSTGATAGGQALFALGNEFQSIEVIQRSANGAGTFTLTLKTPHHFLITPPGSSSATRIRVSGVGSDYDTLDVFGNPLWVFCHDITDPSKLSYNNATTLSEPTTDCSGIVEFFPTGF